MHSKNKRPMTKAEREHVNRVCCVEGCGKPHQSRGYCHSHYVRARRSGSLSKLKRETDIEYVLSRCEKTESGCWNWTKSKCNGYGKLFRHGRGWPAHAFSYFAHFGQIGNGMQINHKCHNRACINPEHLYAGTQLQNVHDMEAAGRARKVRGEENGNSKVNREIVIAVRESKQIARILADEYQISESLVYAIKKRLVWKHV